VTVAVGAGMFGFSLTSAPAQAMPPQWAAECAGIQQLIELDQWYIDYLSALPFGHPTRIANWINAHRALYIDTAAYNQHSCG